MLDHLLRLLSEQRRQRPARQAATCGDNAMLRPISALGFCAGSTGRDGALRTCRSSSADFPPLCAGLASLRTALSTSTASCFEICASVAPETP